MIKVADVKVWPVGSTYQRQYGNRPWMPAPKVA